VIKMAKTGNISAGREKPRAGGHSSKAAGEAVAGHHDRREHYIDRLLDEALEQTFPASDAVALLFARPR
jgi:hypothetical protein